MSDFNPSKVDNLKAIKDHIIVTDMNFDEKTTTGGIVLLSTDKKLEGIHPRWGKVYKVGPEQTSVQVGQFVCV